MSEEAELKAEYQRATWQTVVNCCMISNVVLSVVHAMQQAEFIEDVSLLVEPMATAKDTLQKSIEAILAASDKYKVDVERLRGAIQANQ